MNSKVEFIKSKVEELLRELELLKKKNLLLKEELLKKEKAIDLLERKYLKNKRIIKIAYHEIESLLKEIKRKQE